MANVNQTIETSPGGLPLVREVGLNTNKNISIGGTATFDASSSTGTFKTSTGAVTIGNGAVSITGNTTFSGTVQGNDQNVVSGSGATVTLTASQAGSLVLFDRAAGIVFTLPAPSVGMFFDFAVAVTITSNNAKVITDAGTTLLAGFVSSGPDNTANKQWVGNGTTHIAVTQNGTTTGGILGSWLRFMCSTTTQWIVTGTLVASGTPATPFATS